MSDNFFCKKCGNHIDEKDIYICKCGVTYHEDCIKNINKCYICNNIYNEENNDGFTDSITGDNTQSVQNPIKPPSTSNNEELSYLCPVCKTVNNINRRTCELCGYSLEKQVPINIKNTNNTPNTSFLPQTSYNQTQNNNTGYNKAQGQNYPNQQNYNYANQGYNNNRNFNSNIEYITSSNRIKGSLMFLYIFNIIISAISIFVGLYIIATAGEAGGVAGGFGFILGIIFFIIPIPCFVISSVAGRCHEFIKNLDNTINRK